MAPSAGKDRPFKGITGSNARVPRRDSGKVFCSITDQSPVKEYWGNYDPVKSAWELPNLDGRSWKVFNPVGTAGKKSFSFRLLRKSSNHWNEIGHIRADVSELC